MIFGMLFIEGRFGKGFNAEQAEQAEGGVEGWLDFRRFAFPRLIGLAPMFPSLFALLALR